MQLHFKNRRGAFVVITALLATSAAAMCALAVDFARIASLRSELQISADAGAVGGAIQWAPKNYGTGVPTDSAWAHDSAYAYAHRNQAMQDTVTVDSVIIGNWEPALRVFTPALAPLNAVRTVVSRQLTGLFLQGFGITLPRIQAKATAWGGAPVNSVGCIKPWAIPYPLLMERLNAYQNIQNTTTNLTRPFTSTDLNTLMTMPESARKFDLHLGNGSINDPAVDSLNISGNYQAVQLGKYWDAATQTYANPGPVNGAQAYRDDVAGVNCYPISIGDSLLTNQGLAGPQNTVAPLSMQSNSPYGICSTIRGWDDNTNKNSSAYGDCLDPSGNVGVSVVALFYLCSTGCTGSSTVQVKMMAAFQIDKVFPAGDGGLTPQFDMAEIRGTFAALGGSGRVGGTSSPLTKVIIVQ
jgi:putative Tad-like protein involved in Flp pilus assembly